MSRRQGPPCAFEQGAHDLPGVQTAQLAAEIEQQIDLLQAATRLIEQGNILQDDRGLAGDLVIDL
jgi:hypothetical protein